MLWEPNDYGQLGISTPVSHIVEPRIRVPLGNYPHYPTYRRQAVAIAAGAYHTCALLDNKLESNINYDYTMKCWGRNDYGQIGQNNANHFGTEAGQFGTLQSIQLPSGKKGLLPWLWENFTPV